MSFENQFRALALKDSGDEVWQDSIEWITEEGGEFQLGVMVWLNVDSSVPEQCYMSTVYVRADLETDLDPADDDAVELGGGFGATQDAALKQGLERATQTIRVLGKLADKWSLG